MICSRRASKKVLNEGIDPESYVEFLYDLECIPLLKTFGSFGPCMGPLGLLSACSVRVKDPPGPLLGPNSEPTSPKRSKCPDLPKALAYGRFLKSCKGSEYMI